MARAKALPLVLVALLASAPLVEAAQEYLTPTWSRTLGKSGRWLTAEEDGRCFVIAERGAILVLTPSGEEAWRWNHSKIDRLMIRRRPRFHPIATQLRLPDRSTTRTRGWSTVLGRAWRFRRRAHRLKSRSIRPDSGLPSALLAGLCKCTLAPATYSKGTTAPGVSTMSPPTARCLNPPSRSRCPETEAGGGSPTAIELCASIKREQSSAEIPAQMFYRDVIVSRDFG